MNSTRRPASRKYSAIAVATNAAFSRTRLGASLVAQTTTERARPAAAQRAVEEVAHLAPALAHQRDDVDVGLGLARDLPHQRRLADARAREEAHPLPFTDGQQPVERAHPQRQRAGHAPARQRIGRRAIDCPRPPPAIGPPPSIGRPRPSSTRPVSASETAIESGRPVAVTVEAGPMPAGVPQRHQHGLVAAEPDHLGLQAVALHLDQLADARARHDCAHDEAGHLRDPACLATWRRRVQPRERRAQVQRAARASAMCALDASRARVPAPPAASRGARRRARAACRSRSRED